MEKCNRCGEEYPEEEFDQINHLQDKTFCVPCCVHFRRLYKDLLIHFLNSTDYSTKRYSEKAET